MGAGDELMVAGRARVAQQTDPRKVRVLYERTGLRWSEVWDGNPRIAKLEERGDFQVLYARENWLRPYAVAKTPERWTWKEYRPPSGEIYFSTRELDFGQRFAGRVILEPTIKVGASPNKQWPWSRWERLAELLRSAGLSVAQLGPQGTRRLSDAEHIVTPTFRYAAAVLSGARLAVLHEGGAHHAAAALNTPTIVIFGGFIAPAVTGYESQVNIFTGEGLGCGMRVPCECCKTAMAKIQPEAIEERALGMLKEQVVSA